MALAHIPISPDPISETKAVLGKMLFEQLERMDPSYDGRSWDDLDGGEQDIYIHAVVSVVRFGEEKISELLAYDDEVSRRNRIVCGRT